MNQLLVTALISLPLFALGGCDFQYSGSETLIKTQARVTADVQASAYEVDVAFKAEESEQALAMASLTKSIQPFEAWIDEERLSIKGGSAQLSGIYQYNPNEKRKLVAYEAMQRFTLTDLDFAQYQKVMGKVPEFKPHNIQLQAVVASESEKAEVKTRLIQSAFGQAKQKAMAMVETAGLCDLSVIEMTEHMQDHANPRMMRMAMAEEAVHGAESKQTLTLNMQVNWQASPCH